MGIPCVFSEPSPKKSGSPDEDDDDLLGHDGSLSDASGQAGFLDLPKRRDNTRSRSSSISSASSPTFVDPYQAHEIFKDLGEFIGHLRIGDNGQAEYTVILADSAPQDPTLIESDNVYLATAPSMPIEPPSADLEELLYDTYFREVHPYYPVLCKSAFYNQLKDERTKPSLMLRHAVMAVAATFTEDERLIEYAGMENLQGYYFYERARTLFDIHIDAPHLSTLQTLLLLVKYQEIAKRRGFYHNLLYFSMCVKFSEWLELHCTTSKIATDKVSAETGRRVFWIIYLLDRLTSTAQGRRFAIEEKSITARHPSVLEEEDGEEDQQIVTHLIESIKLVQCHSTVVRHIREVTNASAANPVALAPTSSTLSTIEARLSHWFEGLSASTRLDGEEDDESSSLVDTIPNSGHLRLFYEANRILLHRAYLSNPVEGNTHMDICTQSALNITRLANNMFEEMPIKGFLRPIRGVYTPVYCLVLASQVHLINISSGHEPTANTAKDRFPKTLSVLRELVEYTAIPEMRESVNKLEAAFTNKTLLAKMEQLRSTYVSHRPFPASPSHSEPITRKQRKRSSPPVPRGPAKRPNNGRQQARRLSSTSPLNGQSSGYHSSVPEPTSQGVTIPPFQTYHLLFGHESQQNPSEILALSSPSSYDPIMVTGAYHPSGYGVSQELEFPAMSMYEDHEHTWGVPPNSVVTTMPQGFGKSVSGGVDSRTFAPRRLLTHEGDGTEEGVGLGDDVEPWSSWKEKQG